MDPMQDCQLRDALQACTSRSLWVRIMWVRESIDVDSSRFDGLGGSKTRRLHAMVGWVPRSIWDDVTKR